MFKEEREVKPYNREEMQIVSEILAVDSNRKTKQNEFNELVKKAYEEDKILIKQSNRVMGKSILKQRLVHLYVSGIYSTREIASMLCIGANSVRKLLRSEEIREMIRAYQETEKDTVDSALKALRIKAVETQAELLESDNDMVRYNVSKDILDRTGHKAEEKKTVNVNHTYEEKLKGLVENVQYEIQEVPYVIDDNEATESQINTEGED